jgi:hypothetical protein
VRTDEHYWDAGGKLQEELDAALDRPALAE